MTYRDRLNQLKESIGESLKLECGFDIDEADEYNDIVAMIEYGDVDEDDDYNEKDDE